MFRVLADHNPQMMLYALGALNAYQMLYNIHTIKVSIVQPRLDSISEWEIESEELIKWGNEFVKPRAEKAFKGEGDCVPGEHCRFCRAKAVCRARAVANLDLAKVRFCRAATLSNTEIGEILQQAQDLEKWAKDVGVCTDEVLKGNDVPGWKAVEGRSTKSFVDTDKAFATLTENGIDESLLYERTPLTLSKIETMLGKSKFAELLTDQVVKSPSASHRPRIG